MTIASTVLELSSCDAIACVWHSMNVCFFFGATMKQWWFVHLPNRHSRPPYAVNEQTQFVWLKLERRYPYVIFVLHCKYTIFYFLLLLLLVFFLSVVIHRRSANFIFLVLAFPMTHLAQRIATDTYVSLLFFFSSIFFYSSRKMYKLRMPKKWGKKKNCNNFSLRLLPVVCLFSLLCSTADTVVVYLIMTNENRTRSIVANSNGNGKRIFVFFFLFLS